MKFFKATPPPIFFVKKTLLKFLFVCLPLLLCGMVFFSQGQEPSSLSPDCKSIGPCASVFQAGESTARDIHALCESVINQDICQGVPEKYRFQCGGEQELKPTDPLAFFKSCGVGFYESGADILAFLWGVMKYALHPPELVRGMARGWESEAAQSARLYLSSEYEKALNEATGPAKSVKALGSVSGAVFGQLFDAIYDFLYREVEEFKCMNMAGRMNTVCYLAMDFLIPPVAAIAFLKQGKVSQKVRESLNRFSVGTPRVLSRVKVPKALETEAGLRAKGFRETHIAGMDEMHRMEAIADALRTNRVDPNMTHIEDFADQVEDHIAFFKRSGKSEEAIEKLAREARQMVEDKKVTYNWWMQWNTKMVEAVDDEAVDFLTSKLKMFSDDKVRTMLKEDFRANPFDLDAEVYLPTTKELGIMAFNQSSSKKLRPLGLVNQNAKADNFQLSPLHFLSHDMDHSNNIVGIMNLKSYKHFHKSFREKVKDLPQDRREKVETILFMITHEHPKNVQSISEFIDLSGIGEGGGFLFKRLDGRRDLLPPSLKEARSHSYADYKNALDHYSQSAINEFEAIARDIQKGR